ncbi:MAG: hypothetical protein GX567_13240 [Clostridia bacterium]|nr:hypothetical protein [Clostridia bacterium]
MDYNKKKKRKTKSVQDMYGIGLETRTSPKPAGKTTVSYSNYAYNGPKQGIDTTLGGIIFGVLLTIAMTSACIYYFVGADKAPYVYPSNVVTIEGVLSDLYASSSVSAGTDGMGTATDLGAVSALPGEQATVSDPMAAAPAVPSNYPEVTSHAELLTQIDTALSTGDTAFVLTKLLCKEGTDTFTGYSQNAVNAFVSYMMANPDRRSAFITSVADANTYSKENEGVFYLALPKIAFMLKVAYADTTMSVATFDDVIVNGTDTVELAPLLPMVYSIKAANASWPQPLETTVDVTLTKPTVDIKIGDWVD